MSSPVAPLTLFRSLLREAKHVNDYNFRSYAIRRVKTGFQANRQLQGYVGSRFDRILVMVSVRHGSDEIGYLQQSKDKRRIT